MQARWRNLAGGSLQRRVLLFMAIGTALSFAILGSLGYLAVRQAIDRSLEQRQVLARTTAAHLEGVLEQNRRSLAGFGGPRLDTQENGRSSLRAALRDLYFQTFFDEGVFLLDTDGVLLLAEPQGAVQGLGQVEPHPEIRRAIHGNRMVVTSAHYKEPGHRPVVSALVPLRDRLGQVIPIQFDRATNPGA